MKVFPQTRRVFLFLYKLHSSAREGIAKVFPQKCQKKGFPLSLQIPYRARVRWVWRGYFSSYLRLFRTTPAKTAVLPFQDQAVRGFSFRESLKRRRFPSNLTSLNKEQTVPVWCNSHSLRSLRSTGKEILFVQRWHPRETDKKVVLLLSVVVVTLMC